MTWSERLKTTFEAFKRMAIPHYVFYIAFNVIVMIVIFATIFSLLIPFMSNNGFYPLQYTSYNPYTPVPPGLGNTYALSPYGDLSYIVASLRPFIGGIVTAMILVWVLSSLYLTGVFHLTKKALTDKAQFRDFRFEGFARILGFYGFITLVGIIILMLGVFTANSFQSEYSLFLFVIVSLLVLLLVGLFLAPWFFSAPFYMLNNLQMSFGESIKASWEFFRRNMFPLWGGFLTVFITQLVFSFLSENSPTLGFLFTLVVFPFLIIIPIVWVLTLETEEDELNPQETSHPYGLYQDTYNTPSPNYAPTQPQPPNFESPKPEPPTTEPSGHEPPRHEPHSPEPPRPEYQTPSESTGIYHPPKDPYAMPEDPYAMPKTPYTTPGDPYNPPPPSPETERETINFCPTCGTKTREGAFYCSQCGTKL